MTTIDKLEKLAELNDYISTYEVSKNDRKNILDSMKQDLINAVLTPEIMAKVEEINAEFQSKYEALENDEMFVSRKAEYDALADEVKKEVVAAGQTIKGSCLMAVYAKGRVSWDTKGLDGYVVAHPEVETFRKVGEPSVSIRKVAA